METYPTKSGELTGIESRELRTWSQWNSKRVGKIKGPDNPTFQLLPTSSKRKVKMAWGKQEREKRWWRIGVEQVVCGRVCTSKLCIDKLCCMHACMHGWMDVWIYICMYVCMHVCMYVFMYVCMVGPQARLFFPRAERGMGVMKTERYLATERCDHCFRTCSLGTAATGRTTENSGCHEDC